MSVIASPCIGVCALDRESRYCTGCWRTVPEIARWSALADEERTQIMAALPDRRQALTARS